MSKSSVIYPRIEAILARKGNGQLYRHDFSTKTPVIGLKDGSLRIPARGRPLHGKDEDGEQWLFNPPGTARRNPHLALFGNPTGGTMAKSRNRRGRFTKRRRKGSSSTKTVIRYRARRGAAKRSSRRVRRNPPVRSMVKGLGGLIPAPKRIAAGMAGAALTRIIPVQAAKFFPQIPLTDEMGLAVKAVSGIAAGFLARMIVGKSLAEDMVFGSLITVGDEAARLYLYPQIGLPISAFLEPSMAAYLEPSMGYQELPGAPEGMEDYEAVELPAYAG